ncbi:hypothetical protein, secreted [gut metagenome]|uniref:Peptidase M60 domain-containing protein n=1 Tax=gut metagenome TaxID=749906 RepID=J9D9Y4_9ZZZZ
MNGFNSAIFIPKQNHTMKKFLTLLSISLCFLLVTFSCKDDDKESLQTFLTIEDALLNHEIPSANQRITIPVQTNLSKEQWKATASEKWLFTTQTEDYKKNQSLIINVSENTEGSQRKGTIEITSSAGNYTINITQYEKGELVIEEDLLIKPLRGKASEHQEGSGIELTYDDNLDVNTHYHSLWNGTKLPVTLEYEFEEGTELDYLIYYPRRGNGNFGEFTVEVCNDKEHKNYQEVAQANFYMSSSPSKLSFKKRTAVTGVRFIVKSGTGGFVSCAEMQFYKTNENKPLDKQLLEVFTDITCAALKEGVSDELIEKLPIQFRLLAKQLKNQTYNEYEKSFRIHAYEPYSNPSYWAKELMTKEYGILDNPMGISVKKGEEIIVLVGNTNGASISLRSIWDKTMGGEKPYQQTDIQGHTYMLNAGVNKITMEDEGQLFLLYNTDLKNKPQNITVHVIPGCGTVTGYFDLKTHQTDEKYKELLDKASHKYFCVKGNKIMFYFHRSKMKEFVPNNILSAIHLWDDIISWEQELMGIEDVCPSQFNNHIFAISPEGSYMWASSGHIAFTWTKLGDILLKDNVMSQKDNAWGPAHEIGHIHQAAINWPSSTESSNNLFSNYILHKLGKYCSRGSELSALAEARCVKNQAWWNMGSATHMNEDTEIHMRMNWQLWNYYHRCEYKKDFWPTLFKLLRADRITESNPGEGQLKFAMKASEAAHEDLTEFFERWGFFLPVNEQIEQYGTWNYKVTEDMIQKAKDFMKKFPKPKHAFYYIEDRKNGDVGIEKYKVGDVGYYSQFKDNVKITKEVTYKQNGRQITVTNGEQAVAFEVKGNGKLLYFSNSFSFELPASIQVNDLKLYAVQADGERKEMKKTA